MTERVCPNGVLVVALIPALMWVMNPASAAGTTARVSGAIVRSADQAPVTGARLHMGDPKSGQMFSSDPTGDDGSFVLAELPPATYSLAVEAEGGLFLVETPLVLAPGAAQTLNLSVMAQPINAKGTGKDDDDAFQGNVAGSTRCPRSDHRFLL